MREEFPKRFGWILVSGVKSPTKEPSRSIQNVKQISTVLGY
jgi:hypothetical protein